jgi:hypothetical protein
MSVVGDDRSGDPLHERCDESDVMRATCMRAIISYLNPIYERTKLDEQVMLRLASKHVILLISIIIIRSFNM